MRFLTFRRCVSGWLTALVLLAVACGPSSTATQPPTPIPAPTTIPTPTPHPSVTLRLNWVKAELAEDVPGFNRGELFGIYIVTNEEKATQGRIPRTGVYGSYVNNTQQSVGLLLFDSSEVGSKLKLYLALWEQDGACLSDYLSGAVPAVLAASSGGLTEIALGVLVSQEVNDARKSGCTSDDLLGEYEEVWFTVDLRGEGTHEVDSTNGNITLNFTIEVR